MRFPNPLHQLGAVHSGHLEVCHQDVRMILLEKFPALLAVGGAEYFKPCALKHKLGCLPNVKLVVTNQNSFVHRHLPAGEIHAYVRHSIVLPMTACLCIQSVG